jgi:DNA-binding beta-propeller fold protein YncE
VAFDSTGKVYVVDQNNHRIQIFTAEGKYLMQFGSYGSGDGKLNGPNGICIDGEDVVYVTEWHNNRVSLHSCQHVDDDLVPRVRFLKSFGSLGSKQGQFKSPYGIALGKDGNIYIADLANDRIQMFDLGNDSLVALTV